MPTYLTCARICRPIKEPGIDSQPGWPVRSFVLARLHRLVESISGLHKRLQIRALYLILSSSCEEGRHMPIQAGGGGDQGPNSTNGATNVLFFLPFFCGKDDIKLRLCWPLFYEYLWIKLKKKLPPFIINKHGSLLQKERKLLARR